MRKLVALAVVMLAAGTAWADVGVSVGFRFSSGHPYHRWYPRPYPVFCSPVYWWYPGYSVVRYYDPMVDVRCEVKPKEASVFVDGYYAGTVDDFDGFFQRLQIPHGRHTITFRYQGYQPYSVSLYGARGQDIHIKQQLMPGRDWLPEDERMQRERRPQAEGRVVPRDEPRDRGYGDDQRYESGQTQSRPRQMPDGQGMLRLDVDPAGASVYIDGEFWGVMREDGTREIGLRSGSHRIEIVKPGFVTFRREVNVLDGQEAVLEADLAPER